MVVDNDNDNDDNLEPPGIGAAKASKLSREIANMWKRIAATGVTPPSSLALARPTDVSASTSAADYRTLLAKAKALRHFTIGAEAAKAPPPQGDDGGDGDEPEPPAGDPPKPPEGQPDAGHGQPSGRADESEQFRRAMKSLREDAVLWAAIAESRALDPPKLYEILRPLASISDDGTLSLADPISGESLPIDGPTLRKLVPGAVAPPPGVTGGSGGGTPAELPRSVGAPDIIQKAAASQKFYEAHKGEVDAELRRRERAK